MLWREKRSLVIGVLLFGLMLCGSARAQLETSVGWQLGSAVAKIRAVRADGAVSFGSAVAIGERTLVTNCHVTHGAARIEVMTGAGRGPASLQAGDAYRDLCILAAPAMPAMVRQIARSRPLAIGEPVLAAGYADGGPLRVTVGQVEALHDFAGAQVIQTSAPFTFGESGGGLFDVEGRLVGVLAFKASAGGKFHFALPSAWLALVEGRSAGARITKELPFWQRPEREQPYFLRAASLEMEHKWDALSALASDWLLAEPGNAAPGAALKKALRRRE